MAELYIKSVRGDLEIPDCSSISSQVIQIVSVLTALL